MRTCVLDGFNEAGDVQAETMRAVEAELAARGWDAAVLTLREMDLAPCTGCFGCWIRRPGMCVQEDASHELCRRIVESDLLITVSPLSFGGYSSTAKAALDRTIGLVAPFFTMVGGEVHHEPRYERMPAMAVLGVNHDGCGDCREVFETLIYRNAINFHPPAMAVEVAGESDLSGEGARARVAGLLDRILLLPVSDLPVGSISREDFAAAPRTKPLPDPSRRGNRRALILTGSPKVHSTSSALGEELAAGLAGRGWRTQAMRILPALNSDRAWANLIGAVQAADLVALLAPLYVDSLPAPVTEALERIARHRSAAADRKDQGMIALLNCGFPEAYHNYTGLAIAKRFAEETGFAWMGGLALGMGGAIDGRPLDQCGRMVRNVRRALDMAAGALDRGGAVPPEAVARMARPFLPRWLYVIMGNWGWKRRARKYGVRQDLYARPYQGA